MREAVRVRTKSTKEMKKVADPGDVLLCPVLLCPVLPCCTTRGKVNLSCGLQQPFFGAQSIMQLGAAQAVLTFLQHNG